MKIIVFRAKTLLIICLIIGVLLSTLYTPAVQLVFSASNGRSLPIYSVQTEEKKIAIGINCAWDDSDIPAMLSCLAEQKINATFFLLGEWAEKYPVSAATIAKSGQEIGSHSYSHRDLDGLSQSEILNEISQSQQSIQKACGQTPILFRPPSGSYNDTVIDCIHQSGCIPIQWSIDTLDWKTKNAQNTINVVLSSVKDGDIILMHDLYGTYADAAVVLIPELKKRGYQLVTVSEMASLRGGMTPGQVYHSFRP